MNGFVRGAAAQHKRHEIIVHPDGHDVDHKKCVVAVIIPGFRAPPLPDAVLGVGGSEDEAARDAFAKARALIDTHIP
jgi:hypothetical protein